MKMNPLQTSGVFVRILGLAGGVFFLVTSVTDTAMAGRHSTWQLMNYEQKDCVSVSNPNSDQTTYYGVWIAGSWTHSIIAGMDGAPDGSSIWGDYLPIAPGSSDGTGSLAYVVVQVAADTPPGRYRMTLWTDDGTTRQRVPVILLVADSCGGY